MPERRFHLGIDYGTSSSKIVFRDYGGPGGEKAFVVQDSDGFRIPSGVVLTGNKLLFGAPTTAQQTADALRYESVKMRVAEESTGGHVKYHYGPKPRIPEELCARDLATLTVWWLISIGHRAVESRLASTGGGDLVVGMTLGVPMSFYGDQRIRDDFLRIARTAWRMYRRQGLLPRLAELEVADARALMIENQDSEIDSLSREEIRDWIRPESEAAMWWAFQSPSVSEGPFAQLDVGAGTTHASLFRIYTQLFQGRRDKKGLAFFAACSVPCGMDAIDERLCQSPSCRGLEPTHLRGREDHVIASEQLGACVASYVKENIWEAYRRSWISAFKKIEASICERQEWHRHKVLLMGGGVLVSAVRSTLPYHPSDNGLTEMQEQQLEIPADLFIDTQIEPTSKVRSAFERLLGPRSQPPTRKPQRADLPFIAVAYGLSNIGIAVPEIVTPSEMPAMPRPQERRQRLSHEDIYAR